ncbi:hypothetical protein BG011_007751 [Mortierella polycephala]|uniref:Uncharacterized protein n=1 Tax=Mortierella polycephala TaxID=41804 RepID=A0A9P6PR40_9FUNG|nr:hypothetical protein BG011_007751 [Mortierella polycephala]
MVHLNALKQRHPKATTDHPSQDPATLDHNKHKLGLLPPTKVHSSFSSLKTIAFAWSLFVGFLALLVLINYQLHYALPTPVYDAVDPTTGRVQFSEERVRAIVRHMSHDIGYRVVGTAQELETKEYLVKELANLKEEARIANLRSHETLPQFDVWVQVGDGSHRFDFMSKGK